MKQPPDILSSATFWAQIATMWAASGAWFTYVAAAVASRQQTYAGLLNLIEGLEAELALVSQWAAGDEGNQGYVSKPRSQLTHEHPDWFNPSRAVFKFSTPTLRNLTNSPYAKSLTPIIRPFVMLNHSIRRIFENIDRYQAFVLGDTVKYQSVLPKFAVDPASTMPTTIFAPHPSQIGLTPDESVYVNHIFMMNEIIHQGLIGGADSNDDVCLYKAFRTARNALQEFKQGLKREPLPVWFWLLHIVAGALAVLGLWEVLRWFDIWRPRDRCLFHSATLPLEKQIAIAKAYCTRNSKWPLLSRHRFSPARLRAFIRDCGAPSMKKTLNGMQFRSNSFRLCAGRRMNQSDSFRWNTKAEISVCANPMRDHVNYVLCGSHTGQISAANR
jgi:hypothetical protein